MSEGKPDLVPGLEDFWAPDESLDGIEREVEKLPPKFAVGRSVPNLYGVVYRGPYETLADGVCTAVRRNACALRRANVPTFLQSRGHFHWNTGVVERAYYADLPPALRAEIDHLVEPKHERTVAWIEHFVPTLDTLIALTSAGRLGVDAALKPKVLKSTAAYIAIEHGNLPESWVERLNMYGRVIVPCQANKRWLEESGLSVPMDVIPHPLGLKDPMRAVKSQYRGGTFRILHVGKWEPRKGQHMAIGGFLEAFRPDEDVQLVLKCNPYWNAPDYPRDVLESLKYWLGPDAAPRFRNASGWTLESASNHIRVIWKMLYTREEMAKLYGACHAYLQSGLSEGFDLGCLDAKVAGLRVAGVGYGGPADFMTGDDEWIKYSFLLMAPPAKQYRMPEAVRWPDPSIFGYSDAMRKLYERRHEPVVAFDVRPFLLDSVGQQLRAVCVELAKNVDVDLSQVEAK